MKIAWLINIVMPELAEELGIWQTCLGGWLIGYMNGIKNTDTELHIITVSSDVNEEIKRQIDKTFYYIIPDNTNDTLSNSFKRILEEIDPDVFHIFGTELKTAELAFNVSNASKTVVSVQGLVSFCCKHIRDNIPERYYKKNLLKSIGKVLINSSIIEDDAIRLEKAGGSEQSIIKRAKHIIGRTTWDRACITHMNPHANYYLCKEILRDSFYTDQWTIENCQKHTILLSQSSSPIKGLHRFLEALPLVLKHYPDTQVYIAGEPLSRLQKRSKLKQKMVEYFCGYQGYIEKLVREYDLYDKVSFLNYLDEKSMKEQYLRANVFVLPSSIENSPNSLGEAMILGVPCVASCVGGIQDMISSPDEGFVFPSDEPYMLAYYICKIFESEELAKSVSTKARQHALDTHDRKKNTEQLLKIYQIIKGIN